ncbi:MAG: hypothetical protein LBR65_09325 [Culturomica sp.]|jgi:hypothetical protein|nr:hypothetical protein [Culturomica sp.]
MQGFYIEVNGKQFSVGLKDGSFGLIIDCRYKKGKISINGMDKNLHAYKWYESQLEEGDSIWVTRKEIPSVSDPTEIIDTWVSDEEKTRLQTEIELRTYTKLRQELIAEGLIVP